jgi:hypothetical protein
MTEPADLTRLRELFGELFGLEEHDTQLPLQLLVNMYRTRLRSPMEKLLQEAAVGVRGARDARSANWRSAVMQHMHLILNERYPGLQGGGLFGSSEAVVNFYADSDDFDLSDIQERLDFGRQTLFGTALYENAQQWNPEEPLLMVSLLSVDGAPLTTIATALEIELGLDPAVRQLVLDYGR